MRNRAGLALILLSGHALLAQPQTERSDAKTGPLPPLRRVTGGELVSTTDPAVSIRVASGFRYAGAQRFLLREIADAEQHLFVDADADKRIRRLFWIQFESLLPRVRGKYEYDKTRAVTLGGVEFLAEVRQWDAPPAEGSDRARAFAFLAERGYSVPQGATRVRLVRLLDEDQRRELMIIYAERSDERVELTEARQEELVRRALHGISLKWEAAR
jgi:hypothetical protein